MTYLPLVLIGVMIATAVFVIERRMAARKQGKPEALLQDWGRQAQADTEKATRRSWRTAVRPAAEEPVSA